MSKRLFHTLLFNFIINIFTLQFFIIKFKINMYKSLLRKRRHSKMSFLLELGGNSLQDYYRQKIEDIYGENYRYNERVDEQLLINILKGAAQALQQFHQRETK